MNKIIRSFISSVAVAAASLMIANSAMAAKTLKIQLAVPTSSDEAKIVQGFADDVANLTQGEVKLELLRLGPSYLAGQRQPKALAVVLLVPWC